MPKKTPEIPKTDNVALTHSPFANLARNSKLTAQLAKSTTESTVTLAQPPKPPKPLPPCKVKMRLETAGRGGKAVTRIVGLPFENLEAIASRLRKGLGCGAQVDNSDLILQGSLVERAEQWLERAGDLRAITDVAPVMRTPAANPAAPREPELPTPSSLSAMNRADVRRGQRVAIVLKADQASGKLTEGIVRDLLTNSEHHPRGIKVRLESGEVGRVQVIFR